VIPRRSTRQVLQPGDLAPSTEEFAVAGVFNPAATRTADETVLIVRVVERAAEPRPGKVGLPRWHPETGPVVDWVAEDEVVYLDPRVVRLRKTGHIRLTFVSHLRVLRSADGFSFDASVVGPRIVPQEPYEEYGVEDPRVTSFGARRLITYVAVSRHGACTALLETADFEAFQRRGVILYPENKDAVLFPETLHGQYLMLHRPTPATAFGAPEIWLARSPDLVHWGEYEFLTGGAGAWELGRIGAGTPPIRVPEGWLEIYHGNAPSSVAGNPGPYAAGAFLLDLERPGRIVRRSAEPVMAPEAEFERNGFVPNVVFPTGIVECGGLVRIYYGAADSSVGVVEFMLQDILNALL